MSVRKDNTEWHEGYRAFNAGLSIDAVPYTDFSKHGGAYEDSRFNRWCLGWNDAYVDSQDREQM